MTAPPLAAAEVLPGGALDLTISGFARFLVAGGDLSSKFDIDPDQGGRRSSFDFRNDTEVHITARGTHDATGIEYGGQIEFEADTNRTNNADETWLFLRSGLGELRLGDTNSAADNMKVGAYTVAVGTGGLDGEVVNFDEAVRVDFLDAGVDTLPGPDGTLVRVISDEDPTRVVYYSPVLAGLQLGVSYTPDGDSNGDELAFKSGEPLPNDDSNRPRQRVGFDDVVSAGLSYTELFGDVGLQASVVGSRGGTVDFDGKTAWGVYGGAVVQAYGFAVAGGLGREELDISQEDRTFWNLGLSYSFDRYAVSVNYGRSNNDQPVLRAPGPVRLRDEDGGLQDRGRVLRAREERTDALVFGAEAALFPGLVLSAELALFEREFTESIRADQLPPGEVFGPGDDPRNGFEVSDDDDKEDQGVVGVIRLGLAF